MPIVRSESNCRIKARRQIGNRREEFRTIILIIACLILSFWSSDYFDISTQASCNPLISEMNLSEMESVFSGPNLYNTTKSLATTTSITPTPTSNLDINSELTSNDLDSNDLSNIDSRHDPTRRPQDFSPARKAFSTVITILNHIILVCGIIANAAVLLVVFKRGKIHPISDIFIANLGIADMLQLVGLIFVLMTEANDNRWEYGYSGCMIFMSVTFLVSFSNSFIIGALANDRYLAVCCAHDPAARSVKRAVILSVACWALAGACVSPVAYCAVLNSQNTCHLNMPEHSLRMFVAAAFSINFLIPLTSIITYHRRVKIKLHEAASLATVQLSSNRVGTYSRATLMLNLIASAFFLSWSFYWIWNLSAVFIPGDIDDFIYYISMIGTTSSYGHSAFSPIIYMCCSDNFKQRFMDIISGNYPCCLSNLSRSRDLINIRTKSVLSKKTAQSTATTTTTTVTGTTTTTTTTRLKAEIELK